MFILIDTRLVMISILGIVALWPTCLAGRPIPGQPLITSQSSHNTLYCFDLVKNCMVSLSSGSDIRQQPLGAYSRVTRIDFATRNAFFSTTHKIRKTSESRLSAWAQNTIKIIFSSMQSLRSCGSRSPALTSKRTHFGVTGWLGRLGRRTCASLWGPEDG